MKRLIAICAMVIFVLAVPVGAVIINYTVSGWGPTQFPGPNTPPEGAPWGVDGYPGDTVELVNYTGTLELTPGSYELKINTLLWTIDYTWADGNDPNAGESEWENLYFNFDAIRSISFNDNPAGSLDQTGLLESTWYNDYLTLNEGATSSFTVGGFQVDVTPLGLSRTGGSFSGGNPWIQPQRDVMARFDVVPEPPVTVALAPNTLNTSPGSMVTVSVNMTVNDPCIITMAAISTNIVYDHNVFTYDANSVVVQGGLLTHDWELFGAETATLRVGGIDLESFESLAAGSGTLFTFTLKVKEDAPTGLSALTWGVYDGYDNATAGFDYGDANGVDIILLDSEMTGASIMVVCPTGDLDGDCDVDFYDFAVLAAAWLSSQGNDNWNQACNFKAEDDIIDMLDLDVFADNWLEGVTP